MAEEHVVDRLGAAGDGVIDTAAGPLFVPGALPGERVGVERIERGRGRLHAVMVPSPDRAEPFCPYFGRCGGCVAQHMGPGLYAGWKRDRLVAALARAGVPAAVEPLVAAGGAGRRRVTFHARRVDGATRVGFMETGSHRLVPIARCPIAAQELDEAAPAAEGLASALSGLGKPLDLAVTGTAAGLDIDVRGAGPLPEGQRQRLIALAGRLDLARLSLHGDLLVERRPPAIPMGPASVVPPPGGFLQATAAGEAALAAAVLAGTEGARRVLDLFAGCGPFALRLATRAEVRAVEADRAMLAALDRAARATPGLRRVTVEARDLFRRPLLPPEIDGHEAVVLDPPRAGAEAQIRQIAAATCRTVVMVSCDPGTFARDAATLLAAGFAAERVVPVDQFVWSAHLEMVGVFRRPPPARRGRRG